ncbi:MAG TPA: aldehyde dehydrogenase [bacterium]|nr:aldehyde dehydrogenase [bacterium]
MAMTIANLQLQEQLDAAALPRLKHYIGGQFVEPASGTYFPDLNPATGQTIAEIPDGNAEDVNRAVSAAWRAAPEWGQTSPQERAAWLNKLADGIERRFDALAELESRDTGKPITLSRTVDIPRAIANFRFFAGAVLHTAGEFHQMPGAFNYTVRRPVGVAALISPWNLPLYLLTWKIAPCLAAGTCAIAKPSELTPLTANALAEIAAEVGLPPGVLNLLHGIGPQVGQPLVEHPQVPAISFTGGTATGRTIAAAAAPRFAKTSLELGGKNPNLIFADCDLEAMLETTMRSSFANQGEICLCGSRLLIERPIYFPVVEMLVERAKAWRVGDPMDPATQMGALISEAHRAKVEGYIALAQEEGGRVLAGGGRPTGLADHLAGGYFLEPTIIGGLAMDCRTQQEEIFGPVITVTPFDTEEEAVALANNVRYGLSATVWTRELAQAHRVAAQLEAGTVWVNTWLLRDLRVPFGGVKESGLGREGGAHSLDFFSEVTSVCVKV